MLEGSGGAFGVEEEGEGKVDRAWGQDDAPGSILGAQAAEGEMEECGQR